MDSEVRAIEHRLSTLEAQREADRATLSELRTDMHSIFKDVREIKNTVVRSRGFVAGATFVIGSLWAAVIGAGVFLFDKIFGG